MMLMEVRYEGKEREMIMGWEEEENNAVTKIITVRDREKKREKY